MVQIPERSNTEIEALQMTSASPVASDVARGLYKNGGNTGADGMIKYHRKRGRSVNDHPENAVY